MEVERSYIDLTGDDLDIMANGGVMIATQDVKDSDIYIRHQLTTDVSTLNFQECSITRNVDSISYFFRAILRPLIGIYNINDNTLEQIRKDLEAGIEDLKFINDQVAGPQLIDARIQRLYQDETLQDTVRVDMIVTVPVPLNTINLHLII